MSNTISKATPMPKKKALASSRFQHTPLRYEKLEDTYTNLAQLCRKGDFATAEKIYNGLDEREKSVVLYKSKSEYTTKGPEKNSFLGFINSLADKVAEK